MWIIRHLPIRILFICHCRYAVNGAEAFHDTHSNPLNAIEYTLQSIKCDWVLKYEIWTHPREKIKSTFWPGKKRKEQQTSARWNMPKVSPSTMRNAAWVSTFVDHKTLAAWWKFLDEGTIITYPVSSV